MLSTCADSTSQLWLDQVEFPPFLFLDAAQITIDLATQVTKSISTDIGPDLSPTANVLLRPWNTILTPMPNESSIPKAELSRRIQRCTETINRKFQKGVLKNPKINELTPADCPEMPLGLRIMFPGKPGGASTKHFASAIGSGAPSQIHLLLASDRWPRGWYVRNRYVSPRVRGRTAMNMRFASVWEDGQENYQAKGNLKAVPRGDNRSNGRLSTAFYNAAEGSWNPTKRAGGPSAGSEFIVIPIEKLPVSAYWCGTGGMPLDQVMSQTPPGGGSTYS